MLLMLLSLFVGDYPDMPGFNRAASDEKAIAISEKVMTAMGGYEAWDQTRYLRWDFFGKRAHVWDKWEGRVRIEDEDLIVLMNVVSGKGTAFKQGTPLAGAELADALKHGYEAWINDAYWLVMPYKLKDSGVTLKYVGEGKLDDGRDADILSLTFADVGVTPDNKYHLMVAKDTSLVESWTFFNTAEDAEARFTTPWANWQKMGSILLSDDRGKYKHTNVAVFEALPDSVFDNPAPLDWASINN